MVLREATLIGVILSIRKNKELYSMSLESTPSAQRVHIGFFGSTNVGKSSLVNRVTSQETSLVSEISGTTTDVLRKAMELLPIGPVVIIDTPGFDDESILGKKRMENSLKMIGTVDVAVLVCDAVAGKTSTDEKLEELFKEKKVPYIVIYNKADCVKERDLSLFYVSALTGEGIEELKQRLGTVIPQKSNKMDIVDSFIKKGDFAVLVTPIDESAPKGRIILPQQNVLRNILDIGATAIVVRPEELSQALDNFREKPSVVITDSQAFSEVSKIVPDDILLTSFSILFAKYRGILKEAVKAVSMIESLSDGDKILISEGCSHHRQCNDIGTVKIPAWIKKRTGKDIEFEFTSGRDFPMDLREYAMVIHCGGCMITEKDVINRMERAVKKGIPFTNYGILIAYINGILKRSIGVFPELSDLI